jgi:hypothetical protein
MALVFQAVRLEGWQEIAGVIIPNAGPSPLLFSPSPLPPALSPSPPPLSEKSLGVSGIALCIISIVYCSSKHIITINVRPI